MNSDPKDYLNPKDVDTVVYHKGCQDGQAAALCAWRQLGDGTKDSPINYYPMHYNDPINDRDYVNKNVLLVDFSWSRENMEHVRKVANAVMILDHHKTAMKNLQGVEGCFFDLSESGASMAWYYFNPGEELPDFIKYVKDRDLWKWEYRKQSEPMYYGLRNKYCTSFRDYDKYIDSSYNLGRLINRGRFSMDQNSKWIERTAKDITICNLRFSYASDLYINNLTAAVLELKGPKLVSEIAEYVYLNNDVDFTMVWWRKGIESKWDRVLDFVGAGTGPYILSFRTNKDNVDVSSIAEMLGGGGHAKAAGAQINYHPRYFE